MTTATAKKPSFNSVVRECLLQFDHPESADNEKLLTLVRTKCGAYGLKTDFDRIAVRKSVQKLNELLGSPWDKIVLQQYHHVAKVGGSREAKEFLKSRQQKIHPKTAPKNPRTSLDYPNVAQVTIDILLEKEDPHSTQAPQILEEVKRRFQELGGDPQTVTLGAVYQCIWALRKGGDKMTKEKIRAAMKDSENHYPGGTRNRQGGLPQEEEEPLLPSPRKIPPPREPLAEMDTLVSIGDLLATRKFIVAVGGIHHALQLLNAVQALEEDQDSR